MAKSRRPELRAKTAEQLKALRIPLRQEILEAVNRRGPSSVKELAGDLRRKPASLYYHLHQLLQAGFLREHGRRLAGRRQEVLYEAAAERILLDRGERSKEYLSGVADLYRATLRATERRLLRALETKPSRGRDRPEPPTLLQLSARLSREAAQELRRRIQDVCAYMAANDDPAAPQAYGFMAALASLESGEGVPKRKSSSGGS